MRSKLRQRLIGLILLAGSGAGIYYVWHVVLTAHQYNRVAAGLLPFFAVFGLALLLFPLDFAGIRQQMDGDETRLFSVLPLVWQLLTLVAVLAGLGNCYAVVLWS